MATAALKLFSAHNKAQTLNLPKINWKVFCVISFIMLFFSLVFYIYQINNLTSGTYSIKVYESKILDLSKENRKLEVSFAESSFLGAVETKTRELNFQKTARVKYIQVPDYLLAKANMK